MGGQVSKITVVPVGSERASLEAVKASFRSFKGEEAECFLPEDRHKLLGVVEASFGDLRQFDKLVRNVFEMRRTSSLVNARPPTARYIVPHGL